jgi:hypothetical protein
MVKEEWEWEEEERNGTDISLFVAMPSTAML